MCTRPAVAERIAERENEMLCYVTIVFAKLSQRPMCTRREDDAGNKMDKEDGKKENKNKGKMSRVG